MSKESEPKPYVSRWKKLYDTHSFVSELEKWQIPNEEYVFEDVYHLALYLQSELKKGSEYQNSIVYRGQRDENWTIIPSIFRPRYPKIDLSEDELKERHNRTISLVDALRKEHPEFSELQCLAIAQHYSYEAETPTWLVDFTYNPLIALNFASQRGGDGQVGAITGLSIWNWEPFGATGDGGVNIVSIVRKIDVPGVPRIERQQALFVDNVHPEILDQGLGHIDTWRFHQHEGLVFEDSHKGVSEHDLLHVEDDAYLDFVGGWVHDETRIYKSDLLSLPPNPYESLTPDDYASILKMWFKYSFQSKYTSDEIDDEVEGLISRLANLHHEIYQLKKLGLLEIEIRLDMLGNAMWDYFLKRKEYEDVAVFNKEYCDILKIRYLYYPDYNIQFNKDLDFFRSDFLREIENNEDREERLEVNQRISDIIDYYFFEDDH